MAGDNNKQQGRDRQSHTMDGLDVGSDLVDELRQLLQVHGGAIPGVLHILNALQHQHSNESGTVGLQSSWELAVMDSACASSEGQPSDQPG